MTDQLIEIYGRLRALRDIMDIPAETMAEKLSFSTEEYLAYESGKRDFSFSFLAHAAAVLDIDVMELLSGESPKLTACAIVRDGQGFDITRPEAYDYKHLAYTFSNKKAEPFMVTVEPEDREFTLHSHEGEEFIYMARGEMEFYHNGTVHKIAKGDSVYFNSGLPHDVRPLGGKPAKFISVVIK